MEFTIEHNLDGSITISTIHNNIWRHRLYIGYTELEAESLFRQWVIRYGYFN